MSTVPADIVNRAIDALGSTATIGDLYEGTQEARVALRSYAPGLRELLRAAHWNFARKEAVLTLLQDATGQARQAQIQAGLNPTIGTGSPGMGPWVYEYAWPIDCVKARFVPATIGQVSPGAPPGNIAIPTTPLFSGMNPAAPLARQRPSPFVVTQDNIPNLVGAPSSWQGIPDTSQTMGQGLESQTVILTNQQSAKLVYTALITYPDQWDPLFQAAFVAFLAQRMAMVVVQDRKTAIAVRDEQIKIAKMALDQARVSDGDEGWFDVNREASWMRARNVGGWGGPWGWPGDGGGMQGYGWSTCGFADGSAY